MLAVSLAHTADLASGKRATGLPSVSQMVGGGLPLAFIRRARGGLIGVEQGLRLRRFSGCAVLGEVAIHGGARDSQRRQRQWPSQPASVRRANERCVEHRNPSRGRDSGSLVRAAFVTAAEVPGSGDLRL